MGDEELKALAEAVAKQRGYADFYHWPEKRQKELGLLDVFSEAAGRIGLQLTDSRLEKEGKDPPDAWAVLQQRVGIEFTEFVDHALIEEQRHTGHAQWRSWTRQEFEEKLLSIIKKKDHAGFGRAVQYWLVIHCDEPALGPSILAEYLEKVDPIATRGLARCFVLLSYDPSIGSSPLLEVAVERTA